MIYAAETTHSNRERKLVQPLEGSPERLRHHLRRPHQRRTTLLIVDRGGLEDQQVQQPGDLRRERTDALVVARLLGQIRKQVSKPPARPGQELPITGESNSTCATARQTSSASVILRGRPGPRRSMKNSSART